MKMTVMDGRVDWRLHVELKTSTEIWSSSQTHSLDCYRYGIRKAGRKTCSGLTNLKLNNSCAENQPPSSYNTKSPFIYTFFSLLCCSTMQARAPAFLRFLVHIQCTTVGMVPPDKRSARHRDLYLTKHNIHNKHQCPRWDSNPLSQRKSSQGLLILEVSSAHTMHHSRYGSSRRVISSSQRPIPNNTQHS